jgi:hypothetical protein
MNADLQLAADERSGFAARVSADSYIGTWKNTASLWC